MFLHSDGGYQLTVGALVCPGHPCSFQSYCSGCPLGSSTRLSFLQSVISDLPLCVCVCVYIVVGQGWGVIVIITAIY